MSATRSIPLSALELSAAVREGRSYDAARLDRVLRVDERHGLVEVQASTPWKAIAAALRPGDPRAAAQRRPRCAPSAKASRTTPPAPTDGRQSCTSSRSPW